MVIKLDFRKAFDSVSWTSLLAVLHARGFPPLFCSWIQSLNSGKTAILLNGAPGSWIQCKNGLRQGDPISPYLYIIFSDVLQQLLKAAFLYGQILHPIREDIQTAILQYADDTLITAKASPSAALHLKHTLDNFASATRLQINFEKTNFVPLNVSEEVASSIATALGSPIQTFLQTYLGLPLSPTKLPPSAYQALLGRIDFYLAGWKAALLSKGGRHAPLDPVLDSLPTYYMASLLLPILILQKIDKKRKSVFWAGEDK
jgi:hypothetical protein